MSEARAIGICPHTGWGACVVVAGSLERPQIVANEIVRVLDDEERFCFHLAAEMERGEARAWIARARRKALLNAGRALAPLVGSAVGICAIVAKDRDPGGDLDYILSAHPRIHAAEGSFYRDAFTEACRVPVRLFSPSSLDPSGIGRLAPPPWGRDQKLAALAAWSALRGESGSRRRSGSRTGPEPER